MSEWHRSHDCESMKKSCGTIVPVAVSPELGKNGLFGPAPSPSMLAGAIFGFWITYARSHGTVRTHHAPAEIAASAAIAPIVLNAPFAFPPLNHPRLPAHAESSSAHPTMLTRMCEE